MLAFITILAPMAIAQMYMVTATGKLTRLDNINQINNFPATKYYTARHFYVSKGFSHFRFTFVVSGKSKSDFDMYIYAAVPVFDHLFPDTNQIAAIRTGANANVLIFIDNKLSNMQRLKKLTADSIRMMRYLNPSFVMPKYGDAGKYGAIAVVTKQYKMKFNQPEMKISPAAWLAVKYIKTISNSLSLPEKENLYKVFTAECDADFKHLQLNKFIYLNRLSYNNRDLKNYVTAIKLKGDVIGNEPIILLPVFEPFANRNGNKLLWIFGSFVIGAGVFLITLQFTPLRDIDFDNLNHAAIIARER
ncbi:hypothetical protein [Mucilaginibacter sp. SP1R1]|uniref:hypothetical protein n=1 Tax=Mucilaginibacter sp. SP1R1 TaxID=2723091 RepID=UPI001614B7EB|nr:hypothetical protein [Mucilaginibacter sp. SP1R1]MBB6147520.1 hypothetical protein [Mucilaginibacter sp. SP1R1]